MKKTICVSILLAVFTMISCNQKTVTKMDSFIEGKVEKVIKKDNMYTISLVTKNDSLVYAIIEKDSIKPKQDFKEVKVGDNLKLKGEVWCRDRKTDCFIHVKQLK